MKFEEEVEYKHKNAEAEKRAEPDQIEALEPRVPEAPPAGVPPAEVPEDKHKNAFEHERLR